MSSLPRFVLGNKLFQSCPPGPPFVKSQLQPVAMTMNWELSHSIPKVRCVPRQFQATLALLTNPVRIATQKAATHNLQVEY